MRVQLVLLNTGVLFLSAVVDSVPRNKRGAACLVDLRIVSTTHFPTFSLNYT